MFHEQEVQAFMTKRYMHVLCTGEKNQVTSMR